MARYFFHLYDSTQTPDDDGIELANMTAARDHATRGLRDTVGHQAFDGILHMNQRIEIADHGGQVLGIVHFADAMEIVG